MMYRRISLATWAGLIAGCLAGPAPAAAERPNVVVILADDMGFSDAGCYGGEIATPHLDRLAAGGLRFTQFYNTARCWPSRACVLTGYYAQQVRRDALPGLQGGGKGVRPAWARLLPAMLKPLGYRSYHSGKWHVDGPVLAGGFDHSYSLNDHNRFFHPQQHTLDDRPLPPVPPGSGYYASKAIAQHAIDMLSKHQQEHAQQPFFLYMAFIAPHFPLHALPEDIAVYRDRFAAGWDVIRRQRYERMKKMGLIHSALSAPDPDIIPAWNLPEAKLRAQLGDGEVGHAVAWQSLSAEQKQFQAGKMAIHAAMIHRMDIEIGRVLAQIRAMGQWDNTLILFASDNGASAEQIVRGAGHDRQASPGSAATFLCLGPGWSTAANTPHRLHKSWVHEGGITTPLIAHWPQGIAARGALRHNPGHLIDIPPTVLDLLGQSWPKEFAGKPVPTPPGKSLAPVFAADGSVQHDYLWWCHDGHRAIRCGDWKLVARSNEPWELYDLASDRAESQNLAAKMPDKARQLEQAWNDRADEFRALAKQDLPASGAAQKPRARKKARS